MRGQVPAVPHVAPHEEDPVSHADAVDPGPVVPGADRGPVIVVEPAFRLVADGPPPLVRAVGQVQVFRVKRSVQGIEPAERQVLVPGDRHGGAVAVQREPPGLTLGLLFGPPEPQQPAVHGPPYQPPARTPVPGLVDPGIDGEYPTIAEVGQQRVQEGTGRDDVVVEQDHDVVRSPGHAGIARRGETYVLNVPRQERVRTGRPDPFAGVVPAPVVDHDDLRPGRLPVVFQGPQAPFDQGTRVPRRYHDTASLVLCHDSVRILRHDGGRGRLSALSSARDPRCQTLTSLRKE